MIHHGLPARGFISSIKCAGQDWITHADALLGQHPIESVSPTTVPITEEKGLLFSNRMVRFQGRTWRKWSEQAVRQDELVKYGVEAAMALSLLRAEWPKITFIPALLTVGVDWAQRPNPTVISVEQAFRTYEADMLRRVAQHFEIPSAFLGHDSS